MEPNFNIFGLIISVFSHLLPLLKPRFSNNISSVSRILIEHYFLWTELCGHTAHRQLSRAWRLPRVVLRSNCRTLYPHSIPSLSHPCAMHATYVSSMARGKGRTLTIKLLSSVGTGFFYTTRKNVTNTPHKMQRVKFDPVVRRHVLFKEAKIK